MKSYLQHYDNQEVTNGLYIILPALRRNKRSITI